MSSDPLSLREIQTCLDNRELHLILLPTEACNFRCVYCYESFRLKRMEPWVVEGIKRLLSRRAPDLRALSISWFGGEPPLAAGSPGLGKLLPSRFRPCLVSVWSAPGDQRCSRWRIALRSIANASLLASTT